jgi:hypothetical protein
MSRAPGGFVIFTGPNGQLVFREGGVSAQAGNSLSIGADGFPVFQEKIGTIDGLTVDGTDLKITYTNETGISQVVLMPISSICTACGSLASADLISTDALNRLTLGTDSKLHVAPEASSSIPTTDSFSVTTGNSITLNFTPLTTHLLQVFRNGIRRKITDDYTILGNAITFVTAFGQSGGGVLTESVTVDYYR